MTVPPDGWRPSSGEHFDAVILAGGRSRRMGGIDKAVLEVRGTSLLRIAVDAVSAAGTVVIVGPRRDLELGDVRWVQEEPPGGGPVAAISAGLALVSAPTVVVLGADLPSIDAGAVASLAAGIADGDGDGILGVDPRGRDQYLCAAYRADRLRGQLDGLHEVSDVSMRTLVDGLSLTRLALGAKAADVDTPADFPDR